MANECKLTGEEQCTIDYYNRNFESYFKRTFQVEMDKGRERFLKYLPSSGRILDAGCGPGRDALAFTKKGYDVLAFDAAEAMVQHVGKKLRIPVKQGLFQELEFSSEFDGIWASASLVHVSLKDLSDVLYRFWKALKPNGVLSISFKQGEGMKKEGERIFTYMEMDVLLPYLNDFTMLDHWVYTPKKGVNLKACRWLNVLVRKK